MSEVSKYYPIALKLFKKPVLVIGGGRVAERKVRALLGAGSKIRLVSPTATEPLKQLAKQKLIKWARRRAESKDVAQAHIVIAATNDKRVNKMACKWAREHKIWINVVDKKNLSDFISPAVFHAESSIITVYTDGRDPVLSRDLKNFLKERWNEFLSYRNRL